MERIPEGALEKTDFVFQFSTHNPDGFEYGGVELFVDGEVKDIVLWEADEEPDTFVGVLPELHEAFIAWLDKDCEDADREWFEEVKAAPALRFNQGDAFFDGALGLGGVATEIGEAQEPVIMKMLGGKE